MNEAEIVGLFSGRNAIIKNDHVVYTSGRHGSAYVNKDAIYPHVEEIDLLCKEIATSFSSAGIEAVVGPAVAGTVLAHLVARHLGTIQGTPVLAVYADKEGDGFVIKRGYDKLIAGKKVLVVEDILTTGGSVAKVVETARACGAIVEGVGALCNRGGVTPAILGVTTLRALLDVTLDSWPAEECPLCRDGVPVNTSVGKGREFLAAKKG